MTAQILDGKAILATMKAELTERVASLRARGVTPGLGTVLVGDDPASQWYVSAKHRDCAEIGITSLRRDLPATASLADVLAVVHELNADPACSGFLVQQPTGLDENRILSAVDPQKDIDGLHPTNLGWLVLGEPAPLPCTPMGCLELLRRHDVPIAGAKVVVVGRGLTVGRPLGLIFTRRSENATVTLCHTGTRDLAAEVRQADIVIAAAGVPSIVTQEMVKPGAAVLDVGVSRVDGKIAGDVADDVWEVAAWVSPNPGGVGPMTTTLAPAIGTSWRRSSSMQPIGVHGRGAGLPSASQPRFIGCRPSTSFVGSTSARMRFSSSPVGCWTRKPVHAGSALSSRTTPRTSSSVDVAGRSRRMLDRPISAQSLCFAPTYQRLPGSSPTSTVPRPGVMPRSARAATRPRSSSLIVARIALPSRI